MRIYWQHIESYCDVAGRVMISVIRFFWVRKHHIFVFAVLTSPMLNPIQSNKDKNMHRDGEENTPVLFPFISVAQ